MTTERIDIVVTKSGDKEAAKGIADIGKSAEGSTKQVDGFSTSMTFLKSVLGGLAVGSLISQYQQMADTFSGIIARLRLVSTSAKELVATEKSLLDSANRTNSSFEETANLYTKLATQAGALGIEQKTLIPTIETINQLIAISGTSASEAKSGLLQFSQGLASNRFQGDELRSVLENLPALGQAIAKGLGVTTAGLRKMGESGQLSAKLVLDALNKSAPEIARQFASVPVTIGGAFQVLKNNLLQLVGSFDQVNGVSSVFASAVLFMANNVGTLAKVLGSAAFAAAAFYAVIGAQAAWAAFGAAVFAANARLQAYVAWAAAANVQTTILQRSLVVLGLTVTAPFALIVAAIAGVVAAFYFFGNSIKLNSDGSITALGAVVGIWNVLWDKMKVVGAWIATALGPIFSFIGNLIVTVFTGALAVMQKILTFLGTFIPSMKTASADLASFGATVIKSMTDATTSLSQGGLATKDFGDQFKKTGDDVGGATDVMSRGVNKVSESLVQMGRVNAAAIPPFENLVNAAERSREAIERARVNMDEYSKKVDANSAAVKALALTTRNAMGDMVSSTDEWARRSGAQYNRVAEAAKGAADAIEQAAGASSSSSSSGSSGSFGGGGGSSSRSFQYFDNDITGGQGSSGTPQSNYWNGNGVSPWGGNPTAGSLAPGPSVDWQGKKYQTRWGNGELQFMMNGAWKPDPRPWTQNAKGFANGGAFDVGGNGGTDSQLVRFMASPNERVTIETPEQQRKSRQGNVVSNKTVNVTMNVQSPDPGAFRRSENQMLLSLRSKLAGI